MILTLAAFGFAFLFKHYAERGLERCRDPRVQPGYATQDKDYAYQTLPDGRTRMRPFQSSKKRLDCERPQSKDDYENCQQWRAAEYAAEQACVAGVQFWVGGVIGIFGLVGLLGTIIYTARSSIAATNQVRLSRHALVDTDRAFIFPKETVWAAAKDPRAGKVVDWRIAQRWENSGNTPTRYLRMYFHCAVRQGELPENFDFPDAEGAKTIHALIAPKSTLESDQLVVSLDQMDAIQARKMFLYTWGWAEYDDVFEGTPRHRTEFCYRWTLGGDPRTSERMSFRYSLHKQHNGADEECLKPLQTGSPKNPL